MTDTDLKIDIKSTRVYLVSPGEGKYHNRLLTVFNRLVDAGFKRIQYFKSIPGKTGTSSLTSTFMEIFKIELDNDDPFIIIEDDAELYFDYDIVTVPTSCDILYLGVSYWAYLYPVTTCYSHGRPNICPNSEKSVQPYNQQLTKIGGMTGGHAILYRSRDLMREFLKHMTNINKLVDSVPHDLVFSALHQSYGVYGLVKPMFYQDAKLGGQEDVTKLIFNGHRYERG